MVNEPDHHQSVAAITTRCQMTRGLNAGWDSRHGKRLRKSPPTWDGQKSEGPRPRCRAGCRLRSRPARPSKAPVLFPTGWAGERVVRPTGHRAVPLGPTWPNPTGPVGRECFPFSASTTPVSTLPPCGSAFLRRVRDRHQPYDSISVWLRLGDIENRKVREPTVERASNSREAPPPMSMTPAP